MFEPEVTVAQFMPPTVAQPPRMPFELAVDVRKPLLPLWAPWGSVKSTRPPTLRVIAPRFKTSGFEAAAPSMIADWPELTASPATVWELTVLAWPASRSVPPPSDRGDVAARILEEGAPAAEKSSMSTPPLTAVVPV